MSAGKGKRQVPPLTPMPEPGSVVEGTFKSMADGAAQKVERAIDAINEAKKLNDQLQAQYAVGTSQWHQCESIDDRLHDALTALGD